MSTPRYEDIYGSQYLSPDDLKPGEVKTVTFATHEVSELTCNVGGKVSKATKVVMTVPGAKKKVAINKTSAKALRRAWGAEFKDWCGKPVEIRRGMVARKPCILVTPVGQNEEPSEENVVNA